MQCVIVISPVTSCSGVKREFLSTVCRRFFEDYKKNEHKSVEVGDIFGAQEAKKVIQDSITMYKDEYVPKRQR